MRYLVLIAVLFSIGISVPAQPQTTPVRPYEIKLKAYIDCVEQEFHKNAASVGNTLESAKSAQDSCQSFYEEAIIIASAAGEPVDIVRNAMELSKETVPKMIVAEISELVSEAVSGVAAIQFSLDQCPLIDKKNTA